MGTLSISESLIQFNLDRVEINFNGLSVLLGWACINIFISAIFLFKQKNAWKFFLIMNIGWNVINFILALSGIYDLSTSSDFLGFTETIKQQQYIERLLLFNGGLDVGYVFFGFWLKEKGQNSAVINVKLKGFGYSIILQGAWLFVFDLCFFYAHYLHGQELLNLLTVFIR